MLCLVFGASAFLGFNFSNHVGIQGELIYSSISKIVGDFNVERKINFMVCKHSNLAFAHTGKSKVINLNVVAGPQIGFNVGNSLTMSGANDISNPQPVLSVKKNDFGFAYGAGIDFGLNTAHTVRLGLGYRGVIGSWCQRQKQICNNRFLLCIWLNSCQKTNSVYIGLSILFWYFFHHQYNISFLLQSPL